MSDLKNNEWINDTFVRCWCCDVVITRISLSNADGFCPECDAEVDLSDDPYASHEETTNE